MTISEELTFEEFCSLPMETRWHMSFDWGSQSIRRNDTIGLTVETSVKRKVHGDIYSGWRTGESYYQLDGDGTIHTSVDQVYVAYMEKVCGVTP